MNDLTVFQVPQGFQYPWGQSLQISCAVRSCGKHDNRNIPFSYVLLIRDTLIESDQNVELVPCQ